MSVTIMDFSPALTAAFNEYNNQLSLFRSQFIDGANGANDTPVQTNDAPVVITLGSSPFPFGEFRVLSNARAWFDAFRAWRDGRKDPSCPHGYDLHMEQTAYLRSSPSPL